MAHQQSPRIFASLAFLLAVLVILSPRAARPQGRLSTPQLTPGELQHYQQARTIMDWSPEEIRSYPELENLQPAESQRDLPLILQKVGERVVALFEKLPDTTSTEEVRWHYRAVEPHSAVTGTSRRYFRYLLLVHPGQGAPVLEEYRTTLLEDPYGVPVEPQGGTVGNPVDFDRLEHAPMLASRLITTLLNFHPQKQATCRFLYLGRQMLDERESVVVAFAQIPETNPEASVLRLPDKTVELLTQGLAWFDSATYEIQRIQTDLLAPRTDLGLSKATITIDFKAIHIEGVQLARRGEISATFQLPTRAVVNGNLFGQDFRNIHDYSDFKLFRVESRLGPATENPVRPETHDNLTLSTASPAPSYHADPWFTPLMIMYHKSEARGEMIRNSDREALGFSSEQFKPIRDVGQRLEVELREIDARKKVIIDAERSEHPQPPELTAFRQQYQAMIESEVANLKETLGADLSTRVDKYIQSHDAMVAAHHSGPPHANAHAPYTNSFLGYNSLLMSVNSNDRGATDLEELDDVDGTFLRDQLQNNLGFTAEQFEPIRATAQRLQAKRNELFTKRMPVLEAYSATLPVTPELKALNQQRETVIDTDIADLRRTLGPDLSAKLEAYFRVYYGL